MIFADLALARRLEMADAATGAEYAQTHALLYPQTGAASLPVAGTQASFAGVESPLTQAFALGMNGSITAAELDQIEEFYRSRGTAVNLEVCPLADPSVRELLADRGYRPVEHTNVLVRSLDPNGAFTPSSAAIRISQPTWDEAETWARLVAQGFVEGEEVAPPVLEIFLTFFQMPNNKCFLARLDGEPAGGGLLRIDQGLASLAATSALPDARGRGVQSALIEARLAFAAAAGCDLAMVSTLPGSISQRNVERQGFQVVYTRTKWMRTWP
jgi:GNAT superfamily N-acetyltransferase